jgi:hypothetical protein
LLATFGAFLLFISAALLMPMIGSVFALLIRQRRAGHR